MKALIFVLILGVTLTAAAQESNTQQLSSQVERLAALVEQQQKQIEELQKSQSELLQEFRKQTPQTAAATAPAGVPLRRP